MDLRAFALVALLFPLALAADPSAGPSADPLIDPDRVERGYVGVAVCGECHQKEMDLWKGSHHDLAMKEATPDTVLGDFNDAEITVHGVTSRFFRRDGHFFVHTDGPDGELKDYAIRYTFGWYPLQQYLIEFPGGRLQSLGLAWDSRPQDQGGQRWFHLYPNEAMDHTNPLHWTAPDQTWNYQCADCHSTDLQKRYDPESDTYDTRYAEINVACETCHGAGARHVDWARAAAARQAEGSRAAEDQVGTAPDDPMRGLLIDLSDRDGGQWQIDPQTGKPARTVPRSSHTQTETCAQCHSRRGRIWDELTPGAPLAQGFRLALLEPGLYFPDGQIHDEVYVFGSFLQSRMYHLGVVCGDCHEPHSLELRAEGNAVCARCHVAARYDTPEHHHHPAGGKGSGCIDCHMTQRYYMVVDERADHSMRIPRPDLTEALGTPDACTGCHQDKGAAWSAEAVAGWYPDSIHRGPHFGQTLHAADIGAPDAAARLLAVAGDTKEPGIARASALARLHDRPSQESMMTVRRLLGDQDTQVRAEAVRFLELADLRTRIELAWPLLSDPQRTVRLEAARVLAPVMRQGIGGKLRDQMTAALEEYVAAQMVSADRPEAHLNLGLVAAAAGEPQVAEQAYRTALRLQPGFTPARVNLADLYRSLGRESDALGELRKGLATEPENADLHHAIGLAQVRAGRLDAALESLERASQLSPANSRYAYVYAVALDGADRTAEALPVLEAAQGRDPGNQEVLVALVQYNAKLRRGEDAGRWLDKLAAAAPGDPLVEQLRASIESPGAEPAQAGAESPR